MSSSSSQCDFHCIITVAENCLEFCQKTLFTILAVFACALILADFITIFEKPGETALVQSVLRQEKMAGIDGGYH